MKSWWKWNLGVNYSSKVQLITLDKFIDTCLHVNDLTTNEQWIIK